MPNFFYALWQYPEIPRFFPKMGTLTRDSVLFTT